MCVLAYAFSFFMVVDLLIILFIINYFIKYSGNSLRFDIFAA